MEPLDMYCQTHLHRRNSTYYFRAKVPLDLQDLYRRREIKFSLKTRDKREAILRKH